jgi:hypothetical protein
MLVQNPNQVDGSRREPLPAAGTGRAARYAVAAVMSAMLGIVLLVALPPPTVQPAEQGTIPVLLALIQGI